MTPAIVVDVGNSRIKWGACSEGRVIRTASLPSDEPDSWQRQLAMWKLGGSLTWAVSGVHPANTDRLREWLQQRGDPVIFLDHPKQLALRVLVDHPERVGLDRLLNAVAANNRVQRQASKVVIDAGTAITVDWVDEGGAFRGGAILPGFRLMAEALHQGTALLPRVIVDSSSPPLPGTSTVGAMQAGIFWAAAGGVNAVVQELKSCAAEPDRCAFFLTGGDAPFLAPVMDLVTELWPEMTLEGIRLAVEVVP